MFPADEIGVGLIDGNSRSKWGNPSLQAGRIRMLKIGKKKLIVGAVATAVIAAGAGTALAYWTPTGAGSGSASTSAGASNLTITETSTISGLAPGVAPQTVS